MKLLPDSDAVSSLVAVLTAAPGRRAGKTLVS